MSGGARHHGEAAGPWTQDQLLDLALMWGRGQTSREIATALGKSRNAIMGKVHRLGLPARPSPIKRAELGTPKPAPKGAGGVSSLNSVPVAVVPHDGTGILFGQAGTSRCAWPLWDDAVPAYARRVCGCAVARRADGSAGPYCAGHAARAFTRAPARPAVAA